MTIRYVVTDGIITGSTTSFISPEYYGSEEALVIVNYDGCPLYKVVKGKLQNRTAEEIDKDPITIAAVNRREYEAEQLIRDTELRKVADERIALDKEYAAFPAKKAQDELIRAELIEIALKSIATKSTTVTGGTIG